MATNSAITESYRPHPFHQCLALSLSEAVAEAAGVQGEPGPPLMFRFRRGGIGHQTPSITQVRCDHFAISLGQSGIGIGKLENQQCCSLPCRPFGCLRPFEKGRCGGVQCLPSSMPPPFTPSSPTGQDVPAQSDNYEHDGNGTEGAIYPEDDVIDSLPLGADHRPQDRDAAIPQRRCNSDGD